MPFSRARIEAFQERERRAAKCELDDAVNKVVAALKEKGLTSPDLQAVVVARHPIRFSKSTEFDSTR